MDDLVLYRSPGGSYSTNPANSEHGEPVPAVAGITVECIIASGAEAIRQAVADVERGRDEARAEAEELMKDAAALGPALGEAARYREGLERIASSPFACAGSRNIARETLGIA